MMNGKGWMDSLMGVLSQVIEAEGRYLREQLVRVILAIMVTVAALILGLMSVLVALGAGYVALREFLHFPVAGAIGTVALAMLVLACILGAVGRSMRKMNDPPSDDSIKESSSSSSHASSALPSQSSVEAYPGLSARAFNGTSASASADRGSVDASFLSQQGAAGPGGGKPSLSASVMAVAAGEASPTSLVRDHPIAAAGAAFVVGVVVSRLGLTGAVVKTGVLWALQRAAPPR